MVLKWDAMNGHERWLLVECKVTKDGVRDGARRALNDLLAYRKAFTTLLDDQPHPYGLGIAWGRGLMPNVEEEIMLASPDTLASALGATVT